MQKRNNRKAVVSFLHKSSVELIGFIIQERVSALKDVLKILMEKHTRQIETMNLTCLEEVRMAVGQPLQLRFADREAVLFPAVTAEDLEHVVNAACRFSAYAHTETISQGYITISGGHRIGLCGVGILENSRTKMLRYISSISIRIARDVQGCADKMLPYVDSSTLIIGPPGSGKTTLLRDLIRLLSDEKKVRIGVADERGELCGSSHGLPQLSIGERTDIMIGIPKATAAMMLLRTMTPRWIVMDEITTADDTVALDQIAYCGVDILATAHARSVEELKSRPLYRSVIERNIFRKIVVLREDKSYKIEEVAI